ncbi:MAG: hypothetical protein V4675_24520 [Verrucomicrobiota bacterium]
MINIETGQIKFDDGFSLAPETTESDVTCPLGSDWTDREGNRWRWMSFQDSHSWGDFEMAVNAFFKNQKIWTVELAVVDPRFGKSWSEHSEEKEIQRKRFHDQILSDIFGGRYRVFDWGSVWSEYDPNGGSSSFGIHYGGSDPSNPGLGSNK